MPRSSSSKSKRAAHGMGSIRKVQRTVKGKTYTYAMNGYTGKVSGRVPVSGGKLALLGSGVGAAAGALIGLLATLI